MRTVCCALPAALLLALTACGPGGARPAQTAPEAPPADPCLVQADLICETGLLFARTGDLVADVQLADLPADAISDSMESQGGYDWLERTVRLPQGRVVVEGEPLASDPGNEARLGETRVNRIRIESPLFRTREGIRPGSTLSELMQAFPADSLVLTPLPGYGFIQVQAGRTRMFYLIPDPRGTGPEASAPIAPEALPAATPVQAIVVM